MDSIFDLPEFAPHASAWRARANELARREGYYDGSVYARKKGELGWLAPRWMRAVQPLYLPLARAVDVDAGIVPGGWQWPDPDKAEGVTAALVDAWKRARRQVFDWSSWQTRGVLYVHYGAMFGCTGLKIVDDRERGRVRVEPVSPRNFLLIESGQYDSAPKLALWVEMRENGDGNLVEYAEAIDAERVRTFWGGKEKGIDGREAEYRNELGFVPFVEARHIETGKRLGECTYQKAMPLLDQVNILATHLSDIIRKHAEPQWAVIGAEQSNLVKSGDNLWYFPGASDVKAVVPGVDFEGVLAFVKTIADNLHGSLPELAFDELKGKDQIATATVELQLGELILKIRRVRPNYDQGLVDALRMAGRAAASMSLGEIAALDDPALALDGERAVLPPDPMDAIALQQAELALEVQRRAMSGERVTSAIGGDDAG